MAKYRRGFQAYLVRADLGKKGIWYRLFLGHFPNATSALDAIKKYHFKGAIISRNRFACRVGSYASVAQANAKTQLLESKGFFPYTIFVGDTHHVFVGAYLTDTAAREFSKILAASGFKNDVLER